ncbi:oligosaccharide flippase family protein [Orrella daihaiensis]|uniref:Oligosaccharide flippase family protein n=1 Tax=Orrella daihaiensis TaxID=2782176 RepID=A0ABY4AIH1_9BURK|nr:oligosaccharide flippase family protein [Orrella daihaiensis]UOD49728.1 oligosaccharide flippase family protein [Orrella daihaiensis]
MKTVIRSTAALTSAHAAGYLISLAEVPILARALGASAYGELVWVQATALLASIVVDYGFNLSAAREIAIRKNDPIFLKKLCGDVFLAKLLMLSLITLPILAAYWIFTPVSAGMAAAGFLYFVGFGLTPFWYFQGMERMGRAVAIETTARLLALCSLFLFVNSPQDKTLGLTIMAVSFAISTTIAIGMCRFEVGSFKGSISGAIAQIKSSTAFFVYKSSNQIMTTAATTVLGIVADKTIVGIFAPTEKVVKAIIGIPLPIFQAFYPYLSRLFVENRSQQNRQALILITLITAGGMAAAITLFFIGPSLMHLLLGPGYAAVNELLRLMVWLIPLRLLNQTLGFAVLLPAHLEHKAGIATLWSSAIALASGTYFASLYSPTQGATGMVLGLLIGELVLVAALLWLCRHGLVSRIQT